MKKIIISTFIISMIINTSLSKVGVCVFDIDNTLLDVDENLSKAAIARCKNEGYKLAINTAEPPAVCRFDNVDRLAALGLTIPKEVWLCDDDAPTSP